MAVWPLSEAALALVNYALHVGAFVADDPTGHLELGFIVNLDVESARVFDVSARLLVLQLPVRRGGLRRLLRDFRRCGAVGDVVARLVLVRGLLCWQAGGKVSLWVEGFALLREAALELLVGLGFLLAGIRLLELLMECHGVRTGLESFFFFRLDNK